MIPLLGAVLVASLVGSLHCAGMCGPFLAFVVGARPDGAPGGAARLQAVYHLSRGAGYVLLGVAAGAAGRLVDLAGVLAGLQPVAAVLAGVTLISFGLAALARQLGWRLPLPAPPERARRGLRRLQGRALRLPPTTRALAIGASTTLLPCGWLYAFAVTAAGTASPLRGALVMAAFWVGTVPVLAALGIGVRGAAGALGPRLQGLASGAIVLLGLWTLAGRAGLDGAALARSTAPTAAPVAAAVPDPLVTPACCATDAAPENGAGLADD